MLVANSDFSSSMLSPSPVIPNSVETLNESSSPISSIGALSSPDHDDQDSLSTESSIPPRTSGGSSSSSLSETQFDGECDDSQVMPEPQIEIVSTSQTLDDIDDEIWELCSPIPLNVSPGYKSDDDSSQPLLRLQQQALEIEEPSGVGSGLWNLGNTCFINSVLQCFTHTVPLIESLRSYKYQDSCNCNEQFCVIKALRFHIEIALRTSRIPVSPYYFLDNLNCFSPDFQCYQQEDAHEFLQAFLNKLERCCLDRRSYRGYATSQDVNIVDQVFGGRLVSRLSCCNCNSVSETFESSLGLSLEIEDVDNLWSALESFTRVEKLDEQLTCDYCEEKVSKDKQLLLDKLPLIATFHLKRFKNNGFFMEKIFKHIKIPLELDLQPYTRDSSENEVSTKYHLYALVEHLGFSLAYGHYASYVRSAPMIWHHFDDAQVTRIDEASVLSQNSYILFYAREETPWFSSYFEEMQPLFEASFQNSSPKSVLDPNSGECASDISYDNVDKSNKPCDLAGESKERNEDVFLSADSPVKELLDLLETYDFDNPCTEKEENSCLDIEKEGSLQVKLEHSETTKTRDEPCVADSKEMEVAYKDKMARARELDQEAIANTGDSPPKKIKQNETENVLTI